MHASVSKNGAAAQAAALDTPEPKRIFRLREEPALASAPRAPADGEAAPLLLQDLRLPVPHMYSA